MRRGQDQHDPAHSRVRSPGLLVLDDDTLFRTVVSDHLEARGYRCFRAATIADAESMIAVERVDLAIIDCRLPDGRGEAFSCRLRGQQPDAMQVLVTADSTVQPERLSDGGWAMDDFFVKSNEVSELLWRVEMHLAAAGRIRRLRLRERWLQQIATLPSAFVALEAPLIAGRLLPLLAGLPGVAEVRVEPGEPGEAAPGVALLPWVPGEHIRLELEAGAAAELDPELICVLQGMVGAGVVGVRIYASLQARRLEVTRGHLERRRELLRLERRLRRQSEIRDYFLTAISHDLRSPLAVISGQSQLLEACLLKPDAAARAYTGIRQQTERLSAEIERLVGRYRQVVAIDEGGEAPADVAQLARVAMEVLGPTLARRRQRVRLEAPSALQMGGDLAAIRELLHLLIGRVARHCADGTSLVLAILPADEPCSEILARIGPDLGVLNDGPALQAALTPVVDDLGGRVRASPTGIEVRLPATPGDGARVLILCRDPARLADWTAELSRWPCESSASIEDAPAITAPRQVLILDHAVPGAAALLLALLQPAADRAEPVPVIYVCPPEEVAGALLAGALGVAELPLAPGHLADLVERACRVFLGARS